MKHVVMDQINVSFNEGYKKRSRVSVRPLAVWIPHEASFSVCLSTFVACFAPAYVKMMKTNGAFQTHSATLLYTIYLYSH